MRNQTPLVPGQPAFDVTVHWGETASRPTRYARPPPDDPEGLDRCP